MVYRLVHANQSEVPIRSHSFSMGSRIVLIFLCLLTITVKFVEPKGNRITGCHLEGNPRSIIGYLIVECNETQSESLTSSTLYCGKDEFYQGVLFGLMVPMSFRNCELSTLPINVFEMNPSLNVLNISDIGLEMVEKSNFNGAKNLQKLIGRFNKLKALPINVFADARLDYLNFDSNRFTGVETIGMAGIGNLRTLILSSNNVTHLTNESFVNLTTLENLNLSYNNLGHLQTNVFDLLTNLLGLSLMQTNITNLEFMTFARLTKLSVLELAGNPLKAIAFGAHLPVFHNMIILNINSSQIHELSGFSSDFWPKLEFLDITNNDFNCSHLQMILKTFNLHQTKLNVSPNTKSIRDGNYRGIGCHPVENDGTVDAKVIINANNTGASVEHLHSMQQVHDKLNVVHALMTFMIIAFCITVVGFVIYMNRVALIARLQSGRIQPRIFRNYTN